MASKKPQTGAVSVAAKAMLNALPPETMLNASDAATYLGCSESKLADLRKKEKGPPFYKEPGQNGPVRYKKCDLDDWLVANP
jgi:hypothetical protein